MRKIIGVLATFDFRLQPIFGDGVRKVESDRIAFPNGLLRSKRSYRLHRFFNPFDPLPNFSFTKNKTMKHLVLIALLSFGILSTSFAQGKKVAPAAVTAAFKAKFPTVQKAKWDMEEEGEWEAEFKSGGKEMTANFKSDGAWVETETEVEASALPKAVKDAVAAKFAGYKTEEATKVETPEQPAAYEVELEKGETTVDAVFSADGTLLSQKAEKEEDDKDEGKDKSKGKGKN